MLKDEYSTEWISPMKDIFVLNNVLEFCFLQIKRSSSVR
jgi:hypothetical protein